MAMSPRLLRPTASGHPEAVVWRNAVIANGGSVSVSTLNAVSRFCRDIDAADIRDRFYRLNLFAGTGLNAALVPLYRGQSRTGTQYGNTTDTNVNFVSGDYVETGASGGLKGNGTTKRLETGVNQDQFPAGDRHISAYEIAKATKNFAVAIGSREGNTQFFYLTLGIAATNYRFVAGAGPTIAGGNIYTEAGAHFIGNQPTTTSTVLYKNGSSVGTASPEAASPVARAMLVFALQSGSVIQDFSDARLGAYSMGLSFTAGQSVAFYNAMQVFQTAMGRNV